VYQKIIYPADDLIIKSTLREIMVKNRKKEAALVF
jgi:hypothetical protein